MRRKEALTVLKEHREVLRQKFNVQTLRLFGSVARDEAGIDSDIDLLVGFEKTPTLFEFMRLRGFLEGLFGTKVDLITETGLKKRARSSVERDAVNVA